MKFSIYQESRVGKRANNEDRLAHCYSREALLMVIADGMGGHYYGEVAAQIAVQTLTQAFQDEAQPEIADPFLFLQKALNNAHNVIIDFSGEHNLSDSPRTTCVACIIQDNIAYWAHAGDSRLYLIRNGKVSFHTRDHSRVQMLMDQGVISQARAAEHPDRNKVYSCLGGSAPPEIEFSRKTPLEVGDVVALCTDGVWGVLPADSLATGLNNPDLVQAIPILLDEVEQRGGEYADNLSIVAVRWADSYLEASSSTSSASISTQSMARDSITTNCTEFGRNPSQKSELSEEEIERAIEEIRTAIQKYSK